MQTMMKGIYGDDLKKSFGPSLTGFFLALKLPLSPRDKAAGLQSKVPVGT